MVDGGGGGLVVLLCRGKGLGPPTVCSRSNPVGQHLVTT